MNELKQQGNKVALVIGAGDATGGAIAKRFAQGGYISCMTRRNADKLQPLIQEIEAFGGVAYGFASDARKEKEVIQLIEEIEANIGEIDVLVFNIGANVPCSILEETARKYFKIWEMACLQHSLLGVKWLNEWSHVNEVQSFLQVQPQGCVVLLILRHLQGRNMRFVLWRKVWHVSLVHKIFMWRM